MAIGVITVGDLVMVNQSNPPIFGLFVVTGIQGQTLRVRAAAISPGNDVYDNQDVSGPIFIDVGIDQPG